MGYIVRKLKIGVSEQLDELARVSGELYSKALVTRKRVARKKGIYLSRFSMQRIVNSKKMHAHSADASVESYYYALSSYHVRKLIDTKARPPRRRPKYYKIVYKKSAIRIKEGFLVLSNGRGNEPLRIPWRWGLPVFITIAFKNGQYVLYACYHVEQRAEPIGDKDAGVDLGEVHPAAVFDGEQTFIVNGRLLRSFKQGRNKLIARMQQKLSTKQKGSNEYNKIKRSLSKQLSKIDNKIHDICHKLTTKLLTTLYERGVRTVIMGDIRDIRLNGKNLGKKTNQKIHQMQHGLFRHCITYKAESLGINIKLIDEAYTSQECPYCKKRTKPRNRNYKCARKECSFTHHRDCVGAINIWKKYRGYGHVDGVMAPPISLRYTPHMKCSLQVLNN